MKRMNKSLLIKAFSLLSDRDMGLARYQKGLKAMLDARDDLSVREKSAIYKHFTTMYRTKMFDPEKSIKLINQIEKASTGRYKRNKLKETMSYNREQKLPIIFYLCSYHEKPGKDHKEYQGKVYVDRFWRATMKGHPELHWLIDPIEAYIRNHSILTVQEVTNGKPYLLTRPYCKHFLIPINTWDILTSSVSAIKREHPEAVMGTGSVSKRMYARKHGETVRMIKDKIKARINS